MGGGARRRLPDALVPAAAAFEAVLAEIEPAKAGLADVLPGTRLPGRPLPHALDEFTSRLERAAPLMSAWRTAGLEDVWTACDRGLHRALEDGRRLRDAPPDVVGFEGLLGLVSGLLDHLDPFAEADEWFRRARRRR